MARFICAGSQKGEVMGYPHMQADPVLLRRLALAHREQLECYLLVDLSISAATQRLILGLHQQHRTRSLFQATPEEGFAHIAPHLIRWDDLYPPEQDEAICLDQNVPVFSWLWVEEKDSAALYRHLKSQLDMRLPDGGLALLRYYDPRVWLKLMKLLNDGQKEHLLGPVRYWSVRAGAGRSTFGQKGIACD